jgi:hypothetical protein
VAIGPIHGGYFPVTGPVDFEYGKKSEKKKKNNKEIKKRGLLEKSSIFGVKIHGSSFLKIWSALSPLATGIHITEPEILSKISGHCGPWESVFAF